jgi:hypothetical protein
MKRSKEEIEAKIEELCENSDNFTSDNYGSLAADEGYYELSFSTYATENTLREFVNWLYDKKIL